jgi:hypothetical protein
MRRRYQDVAYRKFLLLFLEREVLESNVRAATTALKRAEATGDKGAIHAAIEASENARKAMSAFQEKV